MARPSQILRVQPLEDRCVPAQFNVPWTAPQSLSLSFAPDGTAVDGGASGLFGYFNAMGLSATVWQGEILRAFQTWVGLTNLNIGVTADGGQPIGTVGHSQGDGRFGDIRISGRALPDDVLALTSPPGQGDTRAGDIVLNSNARFVVGGEAAGYDLYSVMLQEAGHALGVPGSRDPASPMFGMYRGVRSDPTPADVAIIQGLYGGPRRMDAHEGAGNASFESAAVIARPSGAPTTATLVLQADLAKGDADVYRIRAPATLPTGGLTVRLSSAASLVAPRLSVYDASRNLVGSMAASGPTGGDLTVQLTGDQSGADYYVRVEAAAGTEFAAGAYTLRIITDATSPQTYARQPDAPRRRPHKRHRIAGDFAGKRNALPDGRRPAHGVRR